MNRKIIILTIAIFVGWLIVVQYNSFKKVSSIVARDTSSNVFREIQILKTTNEQLQTEIESLEKQLEEYSSQTLAYQALLKEIERNQLLNGHVDAVGPGIKIEIDQPVSAIWFTDLMNELWGAGSEAISINEIRLTSKNSWFSQIGEKQVLISGNLLNSPYFIYAIGDRKILEQAITQGGGIISRIKATYKDPAINVVVSQEDEVRMGMSNF